MLRLRLCCVLISSYYSLVGNVGFSLSKKCLNVSWLFKPKAIVKSILMSARASERAGEGFECVGTMPKLE